MVWHEQKQIFKFTANLKSFLDFFPSSENFFVRNVKQGEI